MCSIKFPIEQATHLRLGKDVDGDVTQTAIFPVTLVQMLQKESAGKGQISGDRGDSNTEGCVSRHTAGTTKYICIRDTPSSNMGRIRDFRVVEVSS
jgi:hypothetical protein